MSSSVCQVDSCSVFYSGGNMSSGMISNFRTSTTRSIATSSHIGDVVKTSSNSGLAIVNSTVPESNRILRDRIEAIIDLTKDFGVDLPPMRIQLSPRDDPRMHTDWRIREMALSAQDDLTQRIAVVQQSNKATCRP